MKIEDKAMIRKIKKQNKKLSSCAQADVTALPPEQKAEKTNVK